VLPTPAFDPSIRMGWALWCLATRFRRSTVSSSVRFTLSTTGRRRRVGALAGAFVAGALVLSACSGGDGDQSTSASSVPADATFNTADITFAENMIPHHEQAVEMAELAPDRSTNPDVLDLADRIRAAQGPEIDTLNGWLSDWGVDTEANSGEGMDHSEMDHSGMGGMMSEEDMSALEDANGIDFDRMWLEMMLEHHTGAVGMAQTEIDEGKDADAIAMAEEIKSSQSAEINEMEQLLQSLAGGTS
jgi:uncharacterized protein (DUF305 family)